MCFGRLVTTWVLLSGTGADIGFNVHVQSKLLQHTFVMGASFDLGKPFRPRLNKGFGLGKEQIVSLRFSR